MRIQTHSFIEDLARATLPKRVVHLLLLAIALSGTGLTIGVLSNGTLAARAHVATAATVEPATGSSAAMTVLPTVTVHPDPEIPVLATVTVRASDAGLGVIGAVDAGRPDVMPIPVTASLTSNATGSGFVMPYYSFGKTLRHVSKE
jgi:hypothetical protein